MPAGKAGRQGMLRFWSLEFHESATLHQLAMLQRYHNWQPLQVRDHASSRHPSRCTRHTHSVRITDQQGSYTVLLAQLVVIVCLCLWGFRRLRTHRCGQAQKPAHCTHLWPQLYWSCSCRPVWLQSDQQHSANLRCCSATLQEILSTWSSSTAHCAREF